MEKSQTFLMKRMTTSSLHLTHPPPTKNKGGKMSEKKKNTKKDKVKIAIRYGVAIPERDLMNMLRLDCAAEMLKLSKEYEGWSSEQIFAKMRELGDVFAVTTAVLGLIQDSWKDALQKYAKDVQLPRGFCPKESKPVKSAKGKKGLSEQEQHKIRALRKQGLSIKAIGKEIHRAEKLVADFVRTLPKK